MLLLLLAVWLAPLAAVAASGAREKPCCDAKGSCCRRKDAAGPASGPALAAAGCAGACGSCSTLVRSRVVAAPALLSGFSAVEPPAEPAPVARQDSPAFLRDASLFQRPPPSC